PGGATPRSPARLRAPGGRWPRPADGFAKGVRPPPRQRHPPRPATPIPYDWWRNRPGRRPLPRQAPPHPAGARRPPMSHLETLAGQGRRKPQSPSVGRTRSHPEGRKMRSKIVPVTLMLALVPTLLFGQDAGAVPRRLTLTEAINLARQNAPAYRQVLNDDEVAGAQTRAAYGSLLPQLSTSASL